MGARAAITVNGRPVELVAINERGDCTVRRQDGSYRVVPLARVQAADVFGLAAAVKAARERAKEMERL